MNMGALVPIIGTIMGGLIAIAWILTRHRQSMLQGGEELAADRKAELLAAENEKLNGQVSRLEERITVLERIATDKPNRLSAEIDNLR